jgi:type IV pilus assembly protein PilA
MKKKNIFSIMAGILFGLLMAWLLGFFNHPSEPTPQTALAKPAANPFVSNQSTTTQVHMAVAAPVLPPVPASQSTPPIPSEQNSSAATDAQMYSMDQIRQQSRVKAMTNNLRQLATAASQYMLDKGVRSASYYDLVGTSTDDYIRSINPVMGEDYSGIIVNAADTQVMVVAPDGTVVTYNM